MPGLGLLIFGKRLPEVGRNIGKGIVEFKRGLKEAETEIVAEPSQPTLPEQRVGAEVPVRSVHGKPIEETSRRDVSSPMRPSSDRPTRS